MVHVSPGGGGSGLRSTGARPADWSPLGYGADPVPGEPGEVLGEAAHYARVALEISAQADRLRRLAAPDEALKGDYTEALRESCEELAHDVSQAHGRFEEVSGALYALAPSLDDAMWETAQALEDATVAQQRIDQIDAQTWTPEERSDPTDPRHAAYAADVRERSAAAERLGTARTRAQRAVSTYDSEASRIAARIRDASDDQLKDGRFEGVKAWVKKHADILRAIAQILGAIVLVLAVAIVLLSNPAGWLVLAAIVAGAALLTVDTLLALAGEGSWGDVAWDVVGLLTLGTGALLGKLVRGGRFLTLLKGGSAGGRAAFRGTRAAFNSSGRFGRVAGFAKGVGAYVDELRSTLRTRVLDEKTFRSPLDMLQRRGEVLDDLGRGLTRLKESSFLGSHELASLTDDLARLRGLPHVGDEIVRLHSGSISALSDFTKVANVLAALEIAVNKTHTEDGLVDYHLPGLGDVAEWLDHATTVEIGSL